MDNARNILEARLMQAHGLAYTLSDISGDTVCPGALRSAFYGISELLGQAEQALEAMPVQPGQAPAFQRSDGDSLDSMLADLAAASSGLRAHAKADGPGDGLLLAAAAGIDDLVAELHKSLQAKPGAGGRGVLEIAAELDDAAGGLRLHLSNQDAAHGVAWPAAVGVDSIQARLHAALCERFKPD